MVVHGDQGRHLGVSWGQLQRLMGPLTISKAEHVIKGVDGDFRCQGWRLGDPMGSTGRFDGPSDDL